MTLHQLKVAARQHEQREEWRAAIELYRQAIREGEGTSEGGDPALFNRIGDLAFKDGDHLAACEAWAQAANRYSELGFFNNAIAVSGKILRADPGHLQTFLELARFQARKRVLYEVRQNLTAYLTQSDAAGRGDVAREAIDSFGADFSGWRDLELLLDELLGREAAAPAAEEREGARRDASGLVFLDTGPMRIERASEPPPGSAPEEGHGVAVPSDIPGDFQATVLAHDDTSSADVSPVDGLVPTRGREADAPVDGGDAGGVIEGLVTVERTSSELELRPPPRIEGFETASAGPLDVAAAPLEGLEQTAAVPVATPDDVTPIETVGVRPPTAESSEPAEPPPEASTELPFIDTAGAEPAPVEFPEPDPGDALGQRVLATALLEHGDRARGIAALERALDLYQSQQEWLHAYQVASELIQAEPRAIGRYQARVEVAARMRDAGRLCEAYAELGDALLREGSNEKAIAVYRRVLEIDDRNEHARAALRAMGPQPDAGETPSEFIDFGAMVIDDAGPRTTRMRTETPEVAPDEEDTFRDALAEFKRALDQNLPVEDHQAHYDLGIAFKEMGLLDEAVGEFQKALRAPEVRLRTSEALGQVFFDAGPSGGGRGGAPRCRTRPRRRRREDRRPLLARTLPRGAGQGTGRRRLLPARRGGRRRLRRRQSSASASDPAGPGGGA